MPLKPKNGLLPASARTTASNSSSKFVSFQTAPKKTVAKSVGKAAPGKKPGKKTPRARAGFELYSSDEDVPKQRRSARPHGTEGPLKTLVEEWMSRQSTDHSLPEGGDSREIMLSIERHHPSEGTTQFNKRLVSSTPDPERLLDDGQVDVQMVPERDTDLGPGAEGMSARLTDCRTAAYLTDSERQLVRQQLDAALIEEAQTKNKGLQEQWKVFQMNQQAKAASSSSGAPANQPSVKKKVVGDSAVPQQTRAVNGPRAVTKGSMPQKNGAASKKTVLRAQGNNIIAKAVKFSQGVPLTPAASTWHDIMAHGPPARESDIGVFHHFLNRESADLPPNLQQNQTARGEGQVFLPSNTNDVHVPQNTDAVPNISMGFTPYKGNQTAPYSFVPSGSTPGLIKAASHTLSQPLTVTTDEDSDEVSDHGVQPVHLATPACSPAKTSASFQSTPRNPPLKNGSAAPPASQYQHTSAKQIWGDLSTPATSPEGANHNVLGQGHQPLKFPVQSVNMAYTLTNKDMAENAYKGSYTCDGYYINGTDSKGKMREGELPPQPRPFTPQPTQPSLVGNVNQIGAKPVSVGINKNNSSDAYGKQGNINQNMHNEAMYTNHGNQPAYPPSSIQNFMEHTRPSREAMADMDFAGFPFGADAHLMLSEDELDPPAPVPSPVPAAFSDREVMNGPRRLRALVSELKETCAIEGDMEVCHLVQQICDVIEVLPQLKPTFNLEAEIGLALQPLRSECSQLRRRLRILNQQLKERERQAKEGLEPKVQVEILTLQTENMELQKKLTEAEQSCHKLNLFISSQQQQMQSLQYQLQQKEHEKLVARQENVQQLNRLNQEVEKMSLRNQSLQSKLAAADCQNSVLDLNLKQSNMEITQLQDTLGRMKQAVLEVMQHVDNNAEGNSSHSSAKVRNLPSFRVLSGLLKSASSSSCTSSSENTLSSGRGPLDVSGNQRISKYPKADKNENAQRFYSLEALHKASPRDALLAKEIHKTKELSASKEPCHKPALQRRDTSLSSGKSDGGDAFLSKDSLSTGPIAPSPLTVEAVAAHNEHHESLSERDFSFHSWDGTKQHRASLTNQSLPYHSDPESAAVPPVQARKSLHKHQHIRQWSTGVEDERWRGAESSRHSSFHSDFEHTAAKSKTSSGKADSFSETGTIPTLSEFPLSEAESMKHSARDITQHNRTDHDKKYADTNRSTASLKPPALTPSEPLLSDRSAETAKPHPKDTSLDKRNPSVSSPNSSQAHSISNTSQKDFFQGTELDMSLSTIAEDGLSSVTSLTGASVCTAMSLDDRKFREGVSALDEKISKCKESLQIWKKTFS